MSNMHFATRNNDGQVHDHSSDIEKAFSYFLAEDGYRLDFIFSDGRSIYLHRDPFSQDNIPEDKKNHPAWSSYNIADARVMYYAPNFVLQPDYSDNVVKVEFGKSDDTDS